MSIDQGTAPSGRVSNPYLEGNFAPVETELTAVDLEVDGELPASLNGRYLRNGPNPIVPDPATHHCFTGAGMVHGIALGEGAAQWYRNRWVRTPAIEAERGLPAAPRSSIDATVGGSGGVNVIHHAGRTLALGEVGLPYLLSDELDTVEQYDFGGRLSTNMTAHPHVDATTGEMFFFGYDFGPTHLRYHVADADGALVWQDGEAHHIPPATSNLVDATGAGDSFAGAFLARYLDGATALDVATFATSISAWVIEHTGARPAADARLGRLLGAEHGPGAA